MEQLQPQENDTNPIKIQGIKDSNHGRRLFFDLRNDYFLECRIRNAWSFLRLLNTKRSGQKKYITTVYCSLREVGWFNWIHTVSVSDTCGCSNLIIKDSFTSFYCNSHARESSVAGSTSRDDPTGSKVEVVITPNFWVNVYNTVFLTLSHAAGSLKKK